MKLGLFFLLARAFAGPPPVGLPYSCQWLRTPPAPVTSCAPRPELGAIFKAAELYSAGSHEPPTAEQWKKMEDAVTAMNDVMPESLSTTERIVAQNSALRIGLLAEAYRHPLPKGGALIAKLALPPEKLAETAPDLTPWLGEAAAWTERRVGAPIYFHENIYRLTRHARAVLANGRRVIFTQLVALDTAWKPHVTPIVGEIELRQTIHPAAPACIVVLDAEALHCGSPGALRKREEKVFTHLGGYLTVSDGATNCTSCHRADGVLAFSVSNVPRQKGAAFVAERRATFLKELEKYTGAIRPK